MCSLQICNVAEFRVRDKSCVPFCIHAEQPNAPKQGFNRTDVLQTIVIGLVRGAQSFFHVQFASFFTSRFVKPISHSDYLRKLANSFGSLFIHIILFRKYLHILCPATGWQFMKRFKKRTAKRPFTDRRSSLLRGPHEEGLFRESDRAPYSLLFH